MKKSTEHIDKYRITASRLYSDSSYGMNGAFVIPGPHSMGLQVIVSDTRGWEHVSVSLKNRCPNWPEMCFIKDLFWDDNEIAMQLHPAKKDYVNNHEYCLHLWRPKKGKIPMPPSVMVGIKDKV